MDTEKLLPGSEGQPSGAAMALWRFRIRRLFRSRLGTIFSVLIGLACVLSLINYFGPTITSFSHARGDVATGDGSSRKLAAFDNKLEGWLPPGGAAEGGVKRLGKWKKKTHQGEKKGEEQVCQVPKLTLESDANKDAYHPMPPLACHSPQLFYVRAEDGALLVNRTVLSGRRLKQCHYWGIRRVDDNYAQYTTQHTRLAKQGFELIPHDDFIRVKCYLEAGDDNKRQHRRLLADVNADEDVRVGKLIDLKSPDAEARMVRRKKKKLAETIEEDEGSLVQRHSPSMLGSMGMPDPMAVVPVKYRAAVGSDLDESEIRGNNDIPVARQNDIGPKEPAEIGIKVVKKDLTQNAVEDNSHTSRGKSPGKLPEVDFSEHGPMATDSTPLVDDDYPTVDEPDFDQFIARVSPQRSVFERSKKLLARAGKDATKMDVLIFALDSMSHLSYQRKLPKTYAYLKETMKAVIMNGYNIVGDATTAALVPILTGQFERELPEVRVGKADSTFVDTYPFVWNKYEQQGYVTLYTEDQPSLGTFNLRFNGFEEQPTDHYMRPFWQAALSSELHEASPQYCLGGQSEHQYTLEYIKGFFQRYGSVPKFAFGFLGELSHADNNPAEYIDEDLLAFIEELRTSGALANTLLIVMGDHGARYSKVRPSLQGKLEERLPMMSLAFPQKFKDEYPDLMKNLETNADRLTTPFDLHETLKSVLNIKAAHKPVVHSERGMCLLKPIPMNRTCESARIELHWCSCMQYVALSPQDPRIQKVAGFLLDHINERTDAIRDLCRPLTVKTVLTANMVFPNEKVLRFLKSVDADQRIANFSQTAHMDIIFFQITIETAPSDGLYEATIQVRTQTAEHNIVGDVSRINRYGDQPACIVKTHPDLRKYCFCRES